MKTLIKTTLCLSLLLACHAYANDTIGYVATGGIEYIKNHQIAMQSEHLYISPNIITVDYQFKNLSTQDIKETVLFPLPPVPFSDGESNFVSTKDTIDSFKILVNGKAIKPNVHVRAFVYPNKKDGGIDFDAPMVDVTQIFRGCGLTDDELSQPWTNKGDWEVINRKLAKCQNPKLTQLVGEVDTTNLTEYPAIMWWSQVVYSWQQTFGANALTDVRHSYVPLLGGASSMVEEEYPYYCVDKNTQTAIKRSALEYGNPYRVASYVLTTGANWAKPIGDFKLTVERGDDEVVSFCWAGKGKVTKIGKGKFQVSEKNFKPTKDLDIAFIKINHQEK